MVDYNFFFEYQPGKANVVTDALIHKSSRILSCLALEDWKRETMISEYSLQYETNYQQPVVYNLSTVPVLIQTVKQNQWQDPHLQGV